MLKNNKTKNPASEEINRAIAEVTGGDPDKLVWSSWIRKIRSWSKRSSHVN